jgi:hypothetical protein
MSIRRYGRFGDEGIEVWEVTEKNEERRCGGKEARGRYFNKSPPLVLYTSEPPFKKSLCNLPNLFDLVSEPPAPPKSSNFHSPPQKRFHLPEARTNRGTSSYDRSTGNPDFSGNIKIFVF